MAQQHIDAGLSHALFFRAVPYPGCALFDNVVRDVQMGADFDPNITQCTNPLMRNTKVSAAELAEIRQQACLTTNRPEYVKYKPSQTVENLGQP